MSDARYYHICFIIIAYIYSDIIHHFSSTYHSNIQENNYSEEQIAEFWEWYKKAKPYTEEERRDWTFDGEIDGDRLSASIAEDILTELGLLK